MAIINCPSCNKKTSDKAKVCSNCRFDFVNKSSASGMSEERLAAEKKMVYIKKKYSLQMQAMGGIIFFLLGAVLWYFSGRGFESLSDMSKLLLSAVGAMWYLLTRVRLIIFRKSH